MKIQNLLTNIALADARTSKLLYEKKRYSQSFFFFQQSVEKAFKAYGLITEAVSEIEIKKDIGHNPLKIYRKMVGAQLHEAKKNIEAVKDDDRILKHEVFASLNMNETINLLEEELKILDRLANINLMDIDHDEIIDVLEHLEEIETTKFNPPKGFKEEFGKGMSKVENLIGIANAPAAEEFRLELLKEGAIDQVVNYFLLYIKAQIDLIYISKVFYFCSIITYKHVETTRYPKDGINPLEFYSKKLPVVKFQPDFLRLLVKAIRKLNKLFLEKKNN